MANASSIGIIGGADGPTVIFLTGPDWGVWAAALLAAGAAGFVLWRIWKKRKER